MYSEVVSLCDGKADVSLPCRDDEPISYMLISFHSVSDGVRSLCVIGLRGHWVPANLFLLYS